MNAYLHTLVTMATSECIHTLVTLATKVYTYMYYTICTYIDNHGNKSIHIPYIGSHCNRNVCIHTLVTMAMNTVTYTVTFAAVTSNIW